MFVGGQNGHAEEAMKLYTSLFENSSVDFVAPNEAGNVQQAAFRLDGQDFMAIDGGTSSWLYGSASIEQRMLPELRQLRHIR